MISFYRVCLEKANLLRQKADQYQDWSENGINYKRAQENFWDNVNGLKLGRVGGCTALMYLLQLFNFSYLVDRLIYDI